jgi:hypothetical protein
MTDPNDYIRSFGMSGFLVCDDLRQIEQTFGVDLGHTPKAKVASAVEFYPQFEQAVRGEASEMSEHYEVFYCLEQSIRKLVVEAMEEVAGKDWWNSGKVAEGIKTAAEQLVQKERDNGMTQRSDNLIDYVTFGELGQIITQNWELFQPTLKTKRAVDKVMWSLNLLRGPIAHCCPMQDDEIDRLRLAVKDWFRLIG